MTHIMEIIGLVVLIGLLMGKALISGLANLTAWVMTKLAERGTFNVWSNDDYMKFYTECNGPDIEH